MILCCIVYACYAGILKGGQSMKPDPVQLKISAVVKMAEKDPSDPPGPGFLHHFPDRLFRKILLVDIFPGLQRKTDVFCHLRTERRPRQIEYTFCEKVPHAHPEKEIRNVFPIDPVSVREQQIAEPDIPSAGEGEQLAGQEKFVIPFREKDLPLLFFRQTPLDETAVQIRFILAEGDPQFKNIAQKNDSNGRGQGRKPFQHPEELLFHLAACDMGVSDHEICLRFCLHNALNITYFYRNAKKNTTCT